VSLGRGQFALSASTDGPGTKAKIAGFMDMIDDIGKDALAKAIVDTYVDGSMPTFVLDYLSVAKLVPKNHIRIIKGLIDDCKEIGCQLIGGETAEHSNTFKYNWMFDMAVFSIGFPIPFLKMDDVMPGQRIFGWPSGCLAANGYSLVRKTLGLNDIPSKVRRRLEKTYSELGGRTLAEVLLRPTPIWINEIENERNRGVWFCGHAHITGGGLIDNPPRIIPKDCKAVIDRSAWQRPPIFRLIQDKGKISQFEMDRTFNNGIMMISIVSHNSSFAIDNPEAIEIGVVEKRRDDEPRVQLIGEYSD
jgi:phosphoribosylformylglycinamidine cyclo-ligase